MTILVPLFFHGVFQSEEIVVVDVPGVGAGIGVVVESPVEDEGVPDVCVVVESDISGSLEPDANDCEIDNVLSSRERAIHRPTCVRLILKLLFKNYLLIFLNRFRFVCR